MVKESTITRYKEYTLELVSWLEEQIDQSIDKIIIIKVEDLINKMGPIFRKDISIYMYKKDINVRVLFELKYLLWPSGIVINGTIDKKTGEQLLTFRRATSEDESPFPGLTESIGEEGIYYTKNITIDIVTENPFILSDEIIMELIDELELPNAVKSDSIFKYVESDISITKIGDWKIVKD